MPVSTKSHRNIDELIQENAELQKEIAALKKRKKFGLVWEDKPEDVVERCKSELPVLQEVKKLAIGGNENLPTNLLIEGDNYHALSVLNYTHAGKIDVIYIDPPYNTGAKDWTYNNNYVDENDGYRHSKWLSMMANRLLLAKGLLTENGVLICAIDENELHRLGLLLENIFNANELHSITIVHNPRGVIGKNFSYTHEYAFFSFPRNKKVVGNRIIADSEIKWRGLRDNGGESLREDARNCFYPIILNDGVVIGFGDVVLNDIHPPAQTVKVGNNFHIYPIDSSGVERKWRYARQTVESVQHLLRAKKYGDRYEISIGKNYGMVRTVWQDSKYDSNQYGTRVFNTLVPNSSFNFPKSIFNIYDCIAPIIRTNKNAILLDFFAGSGTTGHAVSLLNKEDNGKRQYILCTNNENGIARDVCYPRIKAVMEGHSSLPEITGIPSNLRYYKTDFVPSAATDANKIKITNRATEMLCVRENTFCEVETTQSYKIFRNQKCYTGIIYDSEAINSFKQAIAQIDGTFNVYVFSLGGEDFAEEFADMRNKVITQSIPESILQTYRQIFKG